MKLSKRITQITGGGSDGWDVFYRARRMLSEGQAVTELTIGEHDIRTDPSILHTMDLSAREGHTGYARRSYRRKPWLVRIAGEVEARAALYAQQLATCPVRR